MEVDQSALTGESLPVSRKSGDAVFSGSILRQGEIDAMVYATGENTYFGKTAQLVEQVQTVSHFQRAVLKIGDYLIVLAVVLVAVILTVSLFRHNPILDTLEFCLVLLVAAIPVAMPTVLSVTMAVGARLLAKKEAIEVRLTHNGIMHFRFRHRGLFLKARRAKLVADIPISSLFGYALSRARYLMSEGVPRRLVSTFSPKS